MENVEQTNKQSFNGEDFYFLSLVSVDGEYSPERYFPAISNEFDFCWCSKYSSQISGLKYYTVLLDQMEVNIIIVISENDTCGDSSRQDSYLDIIQGFQCNER